MDRSLDLRCDIKYKKLEAAEWDHFGAALFGTINRMITLPVIV
jgi:hypothetical protein